MVKPFTCPRPLSLPHWFFLTHFKITREDAISLLLTLPRSNLFYFYLSSISHLIVCTDLLNSPFCNDLSHNLSFGHLNTHLVRDSSDVWRLFVRLAGAVGRPSALHLGKQRICRSNSLSSHFHVSWLSDFIFYLKPWYKSLHQSFFYSFITILPSESGVTLDYSTILP